MDSGTVTENAHTWSFFSSGRVQVDDSFVSSLTRELLVFLPDGIMVGLFNDGLHIGEHVVPYPPEFSRIVTMYSFPMPVLLLQAE